MLVSGGGEGREDVPVPRRASVAVTAAERCMLEDGRSVGMAARHKCSTKEQEATWQAPRAKDAGFK